MIAQDFRFILDNEGNHDSLLFTAKVRDGKILVDWKDNDSDPIEYSMLNATKNINNGGWIVQEVL